MSAPALVFGLVALLAAGTLLIRRRTYLQYVVAAVASMLIAIFVLLAPLDSASSLIGIPFRLDSTWQVLGRPLSLDTQDRAAVGFLFLVGALFFGLGWAAKPGRSFVPVGLIALGLLAGALTIEPFLFAALFLELAAMACVLILIPPATRSERSVLNLLVLYTMAMMAILFTGWLLENVGITSVTPELALQVIVLLGLGFLILLFIPPFHYWLPSIAQHVNPYSLAFVAIVLHSSGMFFLLRFLDNFAWMRADPQVSFALQAAGLLMIAFGTIVAISQISFFKVVAYVLIADIGVSLLAIGADISNGTEIAIGLMSVRVIGLGLWGIAASFLINPEHERIYSPLSSIAALLAIVSLAGAPITAGFPWRWAMLTRLPGLPPAGALLMVISMAAILWSALRWTRGFLQAEMEDPTDLEPLPRRVAVAAMAAACLLLGIFPQLAVPWIALAKAGLANLSP